MSHKYSRRWGVESIAQALGIWAKLGNNSETHILKAIKEKSLSRAFNSSESFSLPHQSRVYLRVIHKMIGKGYHGSQDFRMQMEF